MKVVFFGTPEFAVESLKILVRNNINVVGVVTAPDQPAGRGLQLKHSEVKEFALQNTLKILQPVKMKDTEFLNELQALHADLFIVVAFRMLPEAVWQMPPKGTFNLHASLLPQYRGAAPINHAIINGETITGVTTFFLQHQIDTGNIILQREVEILPDDNAGSLHDKLKTIGADLVLKTIRLIESGDAIETPQAKAFTKSNELKHAPKIFKDNCRINWNLSVINIHNIVRGLSPYPTAFTEIISDAQLLNFKIFKTYIELQDDLKFLPKVISDGKTFLKIACNGGWLFITELQQSGKKRMRVDEFLRGFKLGTEKCHVN